MATRPFRQHNWTKLNIWPRTGLVHTGKDRRTIVEQQNCSAVYNSVIASRRPNWKFTISAVCIFTRAPKYLQKLSRWKSLYCLFRDYPPIVSKIPTHRLVPSRMRIKMPRYNPSGISPVKCLWYTSAYAKLVGRCDVEHQLSLIPRFEKSFVWNAMKNT